MGVFLGGSSVWDDRRNGRGFGGGGVCLFL